MFYNVFMCLCEVFIDFGFVVLIVYVCKFM